MTEINILYEDKDVLVVEKPRGMLSEYHEKEASVPFALKTHGDVTPITRLDRNVGGVMVLAKHKRAAAHLSAQLADHTLFTKEYKAVVKGKPKETEGELTDLLFKDSAKNKTFVVSRLRRGVKEARLFYRVEGEAVTEDGMIALVHVRLYTGRTHQIRVQFASRKHPLLGDGKYGEKTGCPLMLHAFRVSFLLLDGKRITVESPLPKEDYFLLFQE